MKIKIVLYVSICVLFLSSCTKKDIPEEKPNPDHFVEFITETLNLNTFELHDLPIHTNAPLDLVTFSISDESIAGVINNQIRAYAEGTVTITANLKNGKSDALVVVVKEDGNVPFLDVEEDEINLFEKATYQLHTNVTLRGQEVKSSLNFSTTDHEIAAVDDSGRITAKKAGITYINISADYHGYTGETYQSLKRTVKVVIQPQIVLTISSESSSVNNRSDIINGIEYSNKTDLTGSVFLNGEYIDIFDESITWVITNPEIAKVEHNKIVGKAVGETEIYAQITIDGIKYTSNHINIAVKKPIVDVNKPAMDIDLYVNEINLSTSFMLDGDSTILKIYDKANPSVNIFDGEKLINYDEIGPRQWIIESTKNSYLMDIIVASKIITNRDELGLIHTYGKHLVKGPSGITSFDGYFILADNIDMRGTRFRTYCGPGTGATSVIHDGFKGTFDGRGYTVSNASVAASEGGLFATMNQSSVIKNVAFINANVSGDSGLISSNFGGTIENVYVEGKLVSTRATALSPSSLLASRIYDGAKISNTIIKITNSEDNFDYSSAIGMFVTAKEDALNHVYVLGTASKVLSTTVKDKYNVLTHENNGQFSNYSELLLKDLTSFNSYWKFSNHQIEFSNNH